MERPVGFRHGKWLFLLFALGSCQNLVAKPAPALRILFVGNSHTLTHALPRMVARLAKVHGVALAVEARAEPGYSLSDHLAQPRLRKLLHRDWDWVVLQQGPSSLPASRDDLKRSTRLIADELRGRPARIALMSVWPQRAYRQSSLAAEESYRQAAIAVGGCVLPVATAWRLALAREPAPRLYQHDQLHATRAGTTLAAYTILAGLLGEARGGEANAEAADEGMDTRPLADWARTAHREEPQRCEAGWSR